MPEAQPIIQYWHDDDVPHYVVEAAASFDEHNPDLPHLIFDESTAAALIEEHFGARELAAFRSCAVPAMQSDYFRYCAVYALGGVYVDVDFGCKTPLHGLLEEAEGQLFRLPTGPLTSSCFAFRAARHPFLRVAIDVATANIEHGPMESGETATGAMIFTDSSCCTSSALLMLSRGCAAVPSTNGGLG